MAESVTIASFQGDQADMAEVANFYLDIQREVQETTGRVFDDIWDTWHELKVFDQVYIPPGNFWVAHNEDEQLVGCVGLTDEGQNQGMVRRLGVDKSYRQRGLGSLLMGETLDWARNHDFTSLSLETSPKQDGHTHLSKARLCDYR